MNKNGFTLMELLIYLAILSMLTVSITSILITVNKGKSSSDVRTEVNSNVRFAVEKISQDLRSASAVNIPGGLGIASTTLSMTVGTDTIVYDISGGQLRRTLNSGTPDLITSPLVQVNTTTPIFTRLENVSSVSYKEVSIIVSMNISYKSSNPDQIYSETKEITVSLR